MLAKRWLWIVALGAGFTLTGAIAPAAQANPCSELRKQEIHLQRDIALFGPYSYQANERRAIVQRYRQECGYYGGSPYYGGGWNNPYYGNQNWRRGDGDRDRDDRRWRRDRDDRNWQRDQNRGNGWGRGNNGNRGNNGDRGHDRNNGDRGHDRNDGDRHRH